MLLDTVYYVTVYGREQRGVRGRSPEGALCHSSGGLVPKPSQVKTLG